METPLGVVSGAIKPWKPLLVMSEEQQHRNAEGCTEPGKTRLGRGTPGGVFCSNLPWFGPGITPPMGAVTVRTRCSPRTPEGCWCHRVTRSCAGGREQMENPSLPGGISSSLHTRGTSSTATVQENTGWRCPRAEEAPGHRGCCQSCTSRRDGAARDDPSLARIPRAARAKPKPHPPSSGPLHPLSFPCLPPTSLTLGAAGTLCQVPAPSRLLSPGDL